MITVLFFAQLREHLSCEKLVLDERSFSSVQALKASLIKRNPEWETALLNESVLVAVNQEVVGMESLVQNGDEVAFFMPVTGG
jgi:sulfur-carrier protein